MFDEYETGGQQLAKELLKASQVDFDLSDSLTQALVSTFLFGMLHAHSMSSGRSPEDASSLAISVFQNVLHYTPKAAAEGVQNCIDATRPGVHATMNAIIHRGIDGHAQFARGDLAGLGENLGAILARFRN